MKIIVAKNIGFCSGVKRAIQIAEKSLKEDPKPVQFLGSLVHNEKVIEKFKKKGVRFIKDFKEVKTGTLIIQAHGFPPFLNKNNKLIIREATCPLVKRVQLIASSLFKKGYKVIIIGDKKHSETKGIKGYTQNKAIIVEDEKQAKKLPKSKKIGVVVQTTQNLDKFNRILEILKKKSKKIKYFNTLCPEVQNRQKEINLILKKVNGILVVGSHSSANTKRLVEIGRKTKKPVWWINSFRELKKKGLKNLSVLGVASGTSTPDWLIKEIIVKLKNLNSSFRRYQK
jgi:4-hydroxy-3-methylbut-2-enyl diphosphate reductase